MTTATRNLTPVQLDFYEAGMRSGQTEIICELFGRRDISDVQVDLLTDELQTAVEFLDRVLEKLSTRECTGRQFRESLTEMND